MKKEAIELQDTYIEDHHHHCHHNKRIAWTAILTGAFVAVGLGFLLNLFSLSIGLSAFTVDEAGRQVIAIGGMIGLIIAVIAAMGVAGYAAGYLGRYYAPERNLGILYGFTTWSVALLLSAAVMGHLSEYVDTYYKHAVISSNMVIAYSMNKNDAGVSTERSDEAKNNQSVTKVTATSHTLACGAFFLFVLFFIGAFSTCVGASLGMASNRID